MAAFPLFRLFSGSCSVPSGLLFLVLATGISCTSVPDRDNTTESLEIPAAFSHQGGEALSPRWWLDFPDPALHAFIEEALSSNFSLQSSWARLAQAEAFLKRSRVPFFPTVSASLAGDSTERENLPGTDGESYTGSLTAAYEVDLWGSVRNSAQAARLDRDSTAESLQAAAISLSAQVASVYYQLVEQRGQLALLERQIQTVSDTLEVIQTRFKRGKVDAIDVLQQERLLEARRGNRQEVVSRIAVLEHTLALLLGQEPIGASFETPDTLPVLSAVPQTGIPSRRLQARPDVRAAYFELLAADRRAAAAVADQFPSLRINGSLRSTELEVTDLFDSWVASLGASLAQPLFDAGLRRSEVERTRAAAEIRLNTYLSTILTALKEVEDALVQERQQEALIRSLERQVDLASRVVRQSRERYLRGAESFLRVLDAEQTLQNLERSLLTARRLRVDFRINLSRALAGPVELPQPDNFPRYPSP